MAGALLASPRYWAVMNWLPTGNWPLRVSVATPLVSVAEPTLTPLARKLTVPVGVLPARPEATVAVRTSVWVGPGLGIEAVTDTPVVARLVTATTGGETLAEKLLVPR